MKTLEENLLEAIKCGLGVTSSPGATLQKHGVSETSYTFTATGLSIASRECETICDVFAMEFAKHTLQNLDSADLLEPLKFLQQYKEEVYGKR